MKTTLTKLKEAKTIGYFAGVCFIFNAISGPAIPYSAANFQNPGLIFTVLSYILFTLLAGFCNLFLIEAIQSIPGNKYFQGDIEFSTLINFFFGPRMHLVGQGLLYAALQANSIQCLVLTAEVSLFGKTCGITMDFGAICVSTTVADASSPSPFQETMMLVTLGFIIALILSSPFFFYDLDQSILLTVASAFVALVVMFVWIGLSTDAGLILDRVPLSSPFSITYVQTMGTIMLNLGCATVVPSWINIKSNLVRTQSVMWTTLVASTAFYLIIGIFFALGFPSNDSNNSLQALIQLGSPTWLCKASVAVYAYMMLLPSVPVNFIVSFQNLTQNKVMGRKSAYVVAFIVPILVCIPLQTRNYLFLFLTWSSLIFNSSVNFILPLVIYIKSVAFRRSFHDRVLTLHQLKLLGTIHSKSMEIELYLKNQLVVKANLPVTETPITPIPATKQDTPKIVLSPPGEVETGSGPRDELQMGILQAKSGLSREVLDLFGHDGESHEYSNVKIIKKEEYPTLKPNQFLESTSDPGETPVRISAEIVSDDWKPKSLDINESRNTVDESNVSLEKNDGATSKLTFRIARDRMHSKDYPKLDHLTFTDPQMAGFLEDLEDYSPAENAPEDENLFVDIPKPDLLELPKDERLSIHSFRSGSSHPDVLPREMMYKCPPFRAIPKWFPVKRLPFAWGLLGFTIVVSLANLVINGVFTAMGQS